MSNWADSFQFDTERSVEITPDMHAAPKEEPFQDVAPGWYANCYCCSRSYDEQFMVRHEYRREEATPKATYKNGYYGVPPVKVTRYVISYCVRCFQSWIKP